MGIYSTEGIIVDGGVTGNTASFDIINLSGSNITTIFYNAISNPSPDFYVTGGTYFNGTLVLNRQNGSVTIPGFSTGGTGTGIDTYVTGFTYNNNVLTISQNQGQPDLTATLPMDIFITGGTLDRNTDTIILYRQGGNVNITGITDTFLTGGTFNSTTRILTLSQNENGPNLTITGITDNFITGGTLNRTTDTITLSRQNGIVNITGITDTFITGFTYSNNTISLGRNEGLGNLNVTINNFTGLTVNGLLTATTVNAGIVYVGDVSGGTIQANKELVLQQVGDIFGSSILRLRNRNGENGAIYETTDPTITLVDFIFKTAINQRNIRYEARTGSSFLSAPEFQFGRASNPTLVVDDQTVLVRGSGGTITTTLSASTTSTGSLIVRNNPNTGYILTSDSTGNGTWQASPMPGSGATKLDIQSITATATTTSTSGSGTWVDVGSMTLTSKNLGSSATTYTVIYSSSSALSSNTGSGNIRLLLNGVYVLESQRNFTNAGAAVATTTRQMDTIGQIANVKNGDVIKVQFNSPVGQITTTYRTLSIRGVLTQNLV